MERVGERRELFWALEAGVLRRGELVRKFEPLMRAECWELSVEMLLMLRVMFELPETADELRLFIHISTPYGSGLSPWC